MRRKLDLRMGLAEQRYEPLGHRAGQPVVVPFLELHRIGEPAERVAEGADRKLDQHRLPIGRIFMIEGALAFLPDTDAEADVIALGAADPSGLGLGLVQNVASVEVGNPHPPGVLAFRQHHPAALVEIEAHALGPCWVGTG